MQLAFNHITVDTVNLFIKKNITATVLRLDRIHPVISGNKWFKLQYYLEEARQQHKKSIVTFGGAYSNHIVAVAAACKMKGLASAGIIRGEKPVQVSPALVQAEEYDMQLYFISRENYSKKRVPLAVLNDEHYLINEGGYGEKGVEGAATILHYSDKDFTHCCCAIGTGTMIAGLIKAASPDQKVIGISTMKNNFELEKNILALTENEQKEWQIIHNYHFGGYAKYTPALISFMNSFYEQTGIPSDFVYTGKLFYAINDLVKKDFFAPGSRLLVIHSGGLQGNDSLKKGTLIY